MKKVLCAVLLLLVLTAGFCALAQEEGVWDYDNYNLVLRDYTGEGGEVTVPAEIDGYIVETIGAAAFNGNNTITGLTLPTGVMAISDSAVSYCGNMAYVNLPEGLLFIGNNCFNNCYALRNLTVPASVCYIGDTSFISLEGVESIVFEGECPYFSGVAFDWLPQEAVVYVPDDCFDDYAEAFASMGVSVNMQPSGKNAVVYNYASDPALFGFDAASGAITAYNGYELRTTVPAEIGGVAVTSIAPEAFRDNAWLLWVDLPEGVTTIGESAFENCTGILHVEFPETLKEIGERAFAGGMAAAHLELPEGLETIGAAAFENSHRLTGAMYLPEGLVTVGDAAFSGCGWLEEVYIPETVRSIGVQAFANCGLTYAVFEGAGLPEMAGNVFEGCYYLADIDLNSRASRADALEMQAYVDALGIECYVWRMQNPDVDYINDGLDVYENGVMTGYTGTQTHIRPWDSFDGYVVTGLSEGVFRDNSSIEYFAVCYNDEFTTIGAEAFANSSVAVVDLFDSVTTIGEGAFRNCVNIKEITVPASVTGIAADAFEGCTGLEKITFLCDPSILTEGMLDSCTAVNEICGPDTEALDIALYGLPEVVITRQPESVFAPEGEWSEVFVEAEGKDLTYAWYVMWPGEIDYIPDETCTGSVYGLCLDETTEFTSVYCVITDKYGTSVSSDVADFLIDEPETEYTPVPVGPEGEPYFGTWKGVSMEDSGSSVAFADIGMVFDFTFNQDGTVDIYDGTEVDTGVWSVIDGALVMDGAVGTILGDGSLCIDENGTRISFVRGEQGAITMPSAETEPEFPADEPAVPEAGTAAGTAVAEEGRYVCINATVDGYTLDASMLGGEYSIVFHAGGSADFVVVGAAMPQLPWTVNDAGNFVIDYYGTEMEAVPTETGFDLNYFDTMMMHFAAE